MKNKITFTVLLLVLAVVTVSAFFIYPLLAEKFSPAEPEPASPEESLLASDFTVFDAEGNAVKLSDFKGKPVIVNFWATWCGYCVQELPTFNAKYEKYKDDVVFMMVDLSDNQTETVEKASAYIEEQGFSFPVYYDTSFDAADAYNIDPIPLSLFVRADGSLLNSHPGAMTPDMLESYIDLLTGE